MPKVYTTIVVAVSLKVEVGADTTDELITKAVDRALKAADNAFANYAGLSVEGANALVNRKALDQVFESLDQAARV